MPADPKPLHSIPNPEEPREPANPRDLGALRSLAPTFDLVEQIVVSIPVRKPGQR